MTILLVSGDQCAFTFSPCSSTDVGVRDRKARTALGRTRQTCIPFLVTVQNIERRGLAEIDTTGSGGIFGSAGMVESRRAAEVGKYMVVLHRESACYIMYNDCWNAGRPGTLRVG